MRHEDLDYADKELMCSTQELLLKTKESRGLTNQQLDGGNDLEGKTVRHYLTPNYLADKVPLHSSTVQKLNQILDNASLTGAAILDYHKQKMASEQQSSLQQNNNQNSGFQPTINFNGEIKGEVITGNQTVNFTVNK